MGCGSSAPSSVVEGDGGANGKAPERGVRPPPTGASDDGLVAEVAPPQPVKPPLAFEISLDKEEDAEGEGTQGLVKKHPPRPPKRLQRLNTMEASAPTLQELQDKLESAEKRRQTILQSRIASANKASRQMMKSPPDMTADKMEIDDILDSPTKDMTELKNAINAVEHGITA